MAEISAILYSTYQNKKSAKSITSVSPTATPAQIKAFAQAANALTNNEYNETVRIEKLVCDDAPEPTPEPTPSTKPTPTLTLESSSATKAEIFAAMEGSEGLYENSITYDGDGVLSVATSYADIVATVDQDFLYVAFIGEGDTGTVTLYASEGAEYAATSVTFTITA